MVSIKPVITQHKPLVGSFESGKPITKPSQEVYSDTMLKSLTQDTISIGSKQAVNGTQAVENATVRGPVEVNAENFDREVLQSDKPVLVMFHATWCPHCKDMLPVMDQLSQEYGENVKIVSANCFPERDVNGDGTVDPNGERDQAMLDKFNQLVPNPEGFPTFVMVNNGQLVGTKVGGDTIENFRGSLNRLVDYANTQNEN